MKKFTIILLSLCVVFSLGLLVACGGGGGSDDDEDAATWPVEFYSEVGGTPVMAMKAAPKTGTYKYIYFNKNNTYESGDLNNGTLTKTGEGTYSGGDPHNNITLSLTGTFEGSNLSGESVTIGSGAMTIGSISFTKAGSGDPVPPTPVVTWPVRYLTPNPESPGAYFYIDFNKGWTFAAGEYAYGSAVSTLGGGTYSGADPHGDGAILIQGTFGETPVDENCTISGGVFTLLTLSWERQ